MAAEEKPEHQAEELKGRFKEKAGEAAGKEKWKAEGAAEEAKGRLKQTGEKVKEALTGNKKDKRRH